MAIYTAVVSMSDGNYDVSFPDVPGCITYGETLEEAIRSARDALGGCLCAYQDEGVELPAPRLPGEISLQPGEIAAVIDIDLVDGKIRPRRLRERIRAAGPTIHPDLGKQATEKAVLQLT